ncbi:MAG TPA: hypothetical protein ENN75_00720 [candidate division Zixibacteria bacterium]|nr:hypothetical protein [candidate division Zixibacteria bacterium]
MKNLIYILIIGILAAMPLFGQEKDTLDSAKKGEAVRQVSPKPAQDEPEKTSLGGIIESLFKSAAEAYKSSQESESSSRSFSPPSADGATSSQSAPSVSRSSSPPPPSAPSKEARSTSSKSRDVFIDENNNGIDDRREKGSAVGTSKRKSD